MVDALADVRSRLASYSKARARGTAWLLAQMRVDGSLGDPSEGYKYYRALWTFGAVGEVVAAHRVARLDSLEPGAGGRLDRRATPDRP